MIKRTFIIILIIVSVLILSGCDKEINITPDTIDLIRVEDFTKQVFESGISFSFILKNDTNHVIVQNNVYISFPITNDENNLFKMNNNKVEARNNKLNIKAGESVNLFAFIPKENYENNKYIFTERPNIEISGYLNELEDINHFTRSGDISMFDDEYEEEKR